MLIRRRGLTVGLGAALVSSLLALAGAAGAAILHSSVVVETPTATTPHVYDDGTGPRPIVYAINQLGDTMFAGGRFAKVQDPGRDQVLERSNLMGFDAGSGAINDFAPALDDVVWAIETDGDSVYIGGEFTTVNGVSRPAIAKLDASTGEVDPDFRPGINRGRVTQIDLVNGRLIIGGSFSAKLTALNPNTGRNTGYISHDIATALTGSSGGVNVFKFAVNPAGTRLVAVGNFTTVDGQARSRAFMLDLGETSSTLSSWYYQPLLERCASTRAIRIAYLNDVDFSPNGDYFVFVSTGFVPRTTAEIGTALCDAAARFETDDLAPTTPTWINYTGGDTLTSVAATGGAVYVQGHSRWLDNPLGRDSEGPGAVDRLGGGAIDSVTGKALDWDPVKNARTGGYDIFANSDGVWFASDGKYFAGKHRYGIAFTPLP